ncbi:hypothetical protein BYT27DRAFT_7217643 [Phlegmacium glaucopus]|nr:hypothetical protein BYT27DRAFT_7217643 [Phlegmacium glaucopus]
MGSRSSLMLMGLEGNLEDLHEFSKHIILAKPWQYNHMCVPLPWQHVNLQDEGRKLTWGVIWEDGTLLPTPACKCALKQVISALKSKAIKLLICQQILNALSPNEMISPAAKSILDLLQLPRTIKILTFFVCSSNPMASASLMVHHFLV